MIPLLAHQGGWDELAMFGIPIVLAVVGVRMVERRATRKRASAETAATDGTAADTTRRPDDPTGGGTTDR